METGECGEKRLMHSDFELWVGDAAEIRAARVQKQRNDRRDAKHILKLLMEEKRS
jgi:transposase